MDAREAHADHSWAEFNRQYLTGAIAEVRACIGAVRQAGNLYGSTGTGGSHRKRTCPRGAGEDL